MRTLLHLASAALALPVACGGRTEPYVLSDRLSTDEPIEVACTVDADCLSEDACVVYRCVNDVCVETTRRSCDDGDPCTDDTCDPASGECRFLPATYDLDGDGFNGPLPGYEPGQPGACGDDCDDARAAAHPGGQEVCDGADNDCNGVVDDAATYVPESIEPVRLAAADLAQSTPGGVAFNGTSYAATYHGQLDHWSNYFHGLAADGSTVVAPKRTATVGSDSFSGPIVWNGSVYATVWEDRRDNDYEIYFNRLDADGDKLGPDVRISNGPDFSLHPSLVWDGRHFLLVWDDLRSGSSQIYARPLSVDGEPVAEEIPLTDPELEAENPRIALGNSRLGMVFKHGPSDDQRIGFRTLSSDFEVEGTLVEPASGRAVSPAIAAGRGRFFVAWHTRSGRGPGDAIWAAVLADDEDGSVIVGERPVTFGALFARSKTWVPFGDRVLLIWAADYGDGYELYAKMLTEALEDDGPRVQVTNNATDSVSPGATFGPDGDIGIIFRDNRDGPWQTFFSRLLCVTGR